MLRQSVNEFMSAKASATPREQSEPTEADVKASRERAKKRKNKPSSIKGLEEARAEGENQAILAARPADPRRPARDDRARRAKADGLPRRQARPARRLADAQGGVLGLEHAH